MTDKQLLRFATQFRKGILNGGHSNMACFAVSAPLVALLSVHGVKGELIEGDLGHCNHFWIQLEDGRVLDPTADQFNAFEGFKPMPPVYLGPPAKIHPKASLRQAHIPL